MQNLDDKTIKDLIDEAINMVGIEEIYKMSFDYVDLEALQETQPVSKTELCATFSAAGFAAGIKFTLQYLEVSREEQGEAECHDLPQYDTAAQTYKS